MVKQKQLNKTQQVKNKSLPPPTQGITFCFILFQVRNNTECTYTEDTMDIKTTKNIS